MPALEHWLRRRLGLFSFDARLALARLRRLSPISVILPNPRAILFTDRLLSRQFSGARLRARPAHSHYSRCAGFGGIGEADAFRPGEDPGDRCLQIVGLDCGAAADRAGDNGRSRGWVNAAPFSFFNAVSSAPPVVVLGISPGASGGDGYKDTARNIRDTGEFVVNLVDEALAERMNICAVDFPNGIAELDMAELTPVPSAEIRPPRIAQSPVSFECRRITGLSLGPRSVLEVGRVIHIHIRDDLVDPAKFYVATEKMRLIGRMHGRGWYARTRDLFLMDRLSREDWDTGKR
jgi:flavin reductase (DIM6/NTAB) family NADH-FMN oxidoreductase RutF